MTSCLVHFNNKTKFEKKKTAGSVLFLPSKLLKIAILLLQELIKQKKWLVYALTLTPTFPLLGVRKKGKLFTLKKVGLNIFKEILLKHVYKSPSMFFNIFLFC